MTIIKNVGNKMTLYNIIGIATAIITFILVRFILRYKDGEHYTNGDAFFMSAIATLVLWMVTFCVCWWIPADYELKICKAPIELINDNSEIRGSMSGGIFCSSGNASRINNLC